MTATAHQRPILNADAFNCPHCDAFSHQLWSNVNFATIGQVSGMRLSRCERCKMHAIWVDQFLVFPWASSAPLPNADLPDVIARDYDEARRIVGHSPRGAAALLRLAVQKLCRHLGEPGKDLNKDIASLVQKGLSRQVQQALDVVRVVGNNAVHPGQIDFTDDAQIAESLFTLVNLITDHMISQPAKVKTLFESLPESQRQAIQKRDGNA